MIFLAKRIADGDHVEVTCPFQQVLTHDWEPSSKDMKTIQEADFLDLQRCWYGALGQGTIWWTWFWHKTYSSWDQQKTLNFLSLKRTMITIMREKKDDHDHDHDHGGTDPSRYWAPECKDSDEEYLWCAREGLWANAPYMLPILIRQTQTLIRLIVSSTSGSDSHYLTRPLLFLTRHLVIYVRHMVH